jgi:hypothetical protein
VKKIFIRDNARKHGGGIRPAPAPKAYEFGSKLELRRRKNYNG